MKRTGSYKSYPAWIVLMSTFVSLSIYALGFMIVLKIHYVAAILFLMYVLFLEIRLIKNHCIKCYYWGRRCGFGRGIVSSFFFRKGNNAEFCSMDISWKSLIPDMLVWLIPLISGIVMLVIHFELSVLICVILLILISTMGNGFIRGTLTCRYCIQRELGCPAEKLFDTKK